MKDDDGRAIEHPWSVEERLENYIRLERDSEPSFYARGEGSYRFVVPKISSTFEIDYLRRDKGQMKGELLVRCELGGTLAYDGILTASDLNLSSSRTRKSEALHLQDRARTKDVDWPSLLEEFCLRVIAAEREGEPALILRDIPPPIAGKELHVGIPLLLRHPMILFGDGGTAKSYLSLWWAGQIASKVRVAYFDWELDGAEHRERLECLYGKDMPEFYYTRCVRPLVYEIERIRKIIKECKIEYAIFDSISFACDGPAETSEVAARYIQAARSIGEVGSLHIAHCTKNTETGQLKPFGSVFWHNAARATWNIQRANSISGDTVTRVALHNRKANTKGHHRSVGFEIAFGDRWTSVKEADPSNDSDLAMGLSIVERVLAVVSKGQGWDTTLVCEEIDDQKPATVKRTIRRLKKDGRIHEGKDGNLVIVERWRS